MNPYPPYPHYPDPYAHAHAYGVHPAAPPAYYGAPPAADEVSTIFVTGFPQDVKERELNNLLRFIHGYSACQLHIRPDGIQGFAKFETGHAARAAVDLVTNVQFDEGSLLRAEMARKNMFLKADDQSACKRPKYSHASQPGPSSSQPRNSYTIAAGPPPMPVAPKGFAAVSNTKDNPPCSTLFVGNLGEAVSETELQGLFGSQPGFVQLKLVRAARGVTCFIEYADLAAAMAVHQTLQGAILASSDRGGMRIQYSKNPFGKRKDPPMQYY